MSEQIKMDKTIQVAIDLKSPIPTKFRKFKAMPVGDTQEVKYVGLSIEEIEKRYGKEEAIGVYQHIARGGEDPTDSKNLKPKLKVIQTVIIGVTIRKNEDNQTMKYGLYVQDWHRVWHHLFDCTHSLPVWDERELLEINAGMALTDLKRMYH